MAQVVLVAEDEDLIRYLATEYLSAAGFSVVAVANADDAMALVRINPDIDLVFSDIHMPGSMDGIALAEWLWDHRPHIPVILTSGVATFQAEPNDTRRRFLPKPYALEEVERQILELLH